MIPNAVASYPNKLNYQFTGKIKLNLNDYREIDLRRRYILSETMQKHLDNFKVNYLAEIRKENKYATKNKISLKFCEIMFNDMEEDALFNMKLILFYRQNILDKIKRQTLFNLCHNYCKLYTSKHYRKGYFNDD